MRLGVLAAAAVATAMPWLVAANGPPLSLVVVDQDLADEFGAKSLDGSPPAYYFAAATSGSAKARWVLYFKGGGWCIDDVSCADRAKGSLGSTTKLASTFGFNDGFSGANCTNNPEFCEANRVILWYTDGGSFTGNRVDPVHVANGQTIWYRGHANLRAIIESLRRNHGLGEAEEVLVSGGSAGGLSTYLHADEMRDMIGSPSLKRYKAAPASGFFLNHTNVDGQIVYGAEMAYIFGRMNSTGGVPLACRKRVGPGREAECITAAAVWPTMETPTFVMNSAIDSWQTGCVLTSKPVPTTAAEMSCNAFGAPWNCLGTWHECPAAPVVQALAGYRQSFLDSWRALGASARPGFGAFIHTCHTHVGSQGTEWYTVRINGTSFSEAANAWWLSSDSAPAATNTYLPCELGASAPFQCNPTCGSD